MECTQNFTGGLPETCAKFRDIRKSVLPEKLWHVEIGDVTVSPTNFGGGGGGGLSWSTFLLMFPNLTNVMDNRIMEMNTISIRNNNIPVLSRTTTGMAGGGGGGCSGSGSLIFNICLKKRVGFE